MLFIISIAAMLYYLAFTNKLYYLHHLLWIVPMLFFLFGLWAIPNVIFFYEDFMNTITKLWKVWSICTFPFTNMITIPNINKTGIVLIAICAASIIAGKLHRANKRQSQQKKH
jgi:hypothetical protein